MANYLAGVDLGQSSDYTAIAIVEHLERFTDRPRRQWADMHGWHSEPDIEDVFHLVDLRRWRGEPYPKLVSEICRILAQPALRGRVSLTFDASGVGAAVEDLFNAARSHGELEQFPLGVVITAGGESRRWRESLPFWEPPAPVGPATRPQPAPTRPTPRSRRRGAPAPLRPK